MTDNLGAKIVQFYLLNQFDISSNSLSLPVVMA